MVDALGAENWAPTSPKSVSHTRWIEICARQKAEICSRLAVHKEAHDRKVTGRWLKKCKVPLELFVLPFLVRFIGIRRAGYCI